MSTESQRTTGEMDAVELGLLLKEVDRALCEYEPTEPATVTLERHRLEELIAESTVQTAHTVPREHVKRTGRFPIRYAWEEEPLYDPDISKPISPLVVLGVIAMLLMLFFAVMNAS